MPLKPYLRGGAWWAKGRIEYEGQPVTGYIRCSTGASTEAGAWEWCRAREEQERRRLIVGDETKALTFGDAVLFYPATPREAKFLLVVVGELAERPVASITPKMVKNLGAKLMPHAATDTWWRQIVTPVRAVINNAHEEGHGTPPIKIRPFTEKERIAQDVRRGKLSRQPRKPFSREWLDAFCSHADPHSAAMARFMFETAARVDQAVSLAPKDLDLPARRVRLKAQKGHSEQWVVISAEMAGELAKLPAKRPKNRKTGQIYPARVFGYQTRAGYRKRWATICENAGIDRLTAHSARHGFYTELRVRRGIDPITAAKAGRWKNAALPDSVYAHAETDEAAIRAMFRTNPVQAKKKPRLKVVK